jgi:hypothetical protein
MHKRLTKEFYSIEKNYNEILENIDKKHAEVADISIEEARIIESHMTPKEYFSLVDALSRNNIDSVMDLTFKYGKMSMINEFMIPLKNSKILDAHYLIKEGYEYQIKSPNDKFHEQLAKWLDDQGIEYLLDNENNLIIKCGNRDNEYKTSNKVNKLMQQYGEKTIMSDNVKEAKNTAQKRLKAAQDRMDSLDKRSAAGGMMTQMQAQGKALPKVLPDKKAKQDKTAARGRIKKSEFESFDNFKVGQKVFYEGKSFIVNELDCPGNTIGIVNHKHFLMVPKNEIQLYEAVLGMTKVPELNRYLQLAGLPIQEDDSNIEMNDRETGDSVDISKDEMPDHESARSDHISRPENDESPSFGDDEPEQSEEFKEAIGMLDEVHQLVTGMKLSEYKIFVQHLEDFTQRIQRLGREYLK